MRVGSDAKSYEKRLGARVVSPAESFQAGVNYERARQASLARLSADTADDEAAPRLALAGEGE